MRRRKRMALCYGLQPPSSGRQAGRGRPQPQLQSTAAIFAQGISLAEVRQAVKRLQPQIQQDR